MDVLPADAPAPRICPIIKSYSGEEYGFNLHAEKGKGQYIGKIDAMSPAERGGLQEGDKIVGVNGVVVLNESHAQVVARIKENPNRAELMVLDEAGLEWYREYGYDLSWHQPNVIVVGKEPASPEVGYSNGVPDMDPQSHQSLTESPAAPPASIEDKPKPRLCHLRKVMASDEYGFNLHAEKGKGHFIGLVDSGSIGQQAGLERGQRIVGVNGTLIYPTTPHADVVHLIRGSNMSTDLLVASPDVDQWYKNHGSEFSFDHIEEVSSDLSGHGSGDTPVLYHVGEEKEQPPPREPSPVPVPEPSPPAQRQEDNRPRVPSTEQNGYPAPDTTPPEPEPPRQATPPRSPDPVPVHAPPPTRGISQPDGKMDASAFMSMSLDEVKSRTANRRRKKDPRESHMSLQQKHDIVKNL